VDWLTEQAAPHPSVTLGVGDDMALVDLGSEPALLSSDMLLDGVHFDTKRHTLRDIGRKAIACALSDCAAMAVNPAAITVSLALPAEMPLDNVKSLYAGMNAIAAEFDAPIVGGDTTRWDQPLVIDVTILAHPHPGVQPITRSGAKPGDRLYVTGPLGGSLLGRHLSFTPRLREARVLALALGDRLHAMLDISDGLSLDLWRLCRASGVGAMLDETQLDEIVSDDAQLAAQIDKRSGLEHALGDGEDFELLFAADGVIKAADVCIFPVGKITEADLTLRDKNGNISPLVPRGFQH
jgi:thiamine-monophosphate kinase